MRTETLFILLTFTLLPGQVVFATTLDETMQNYQTQAQVQNITSGLNDISNAINTQTRVFQDALRQQQIEALDPSCVSRVVTQVREKDGSAETQRMIDEYKNEMATMDMSNPVVAQQTSSYLNYLYKYLEAQNTQLFNLLIQYCPKYVAAQVQQAAPSRGLQCNGRAWLNCPSGQRFFCPATGDPQCVIDEVPIVTVPTAGIAQSPSSFQKSAEKNSGAKTVPIVESNVSSTSAPTSTFKPGLILRFWSWFTGLFDL